MFPALKRRAIFRKSLRDYPDSRRKLRCALMGARHSAPVDNREILNYKQDRIR
jgi:hypothetical protein